MGQLQAIIVPVTPFQQNCTILFDGDTKKGVVIDPGGDLERIKEAIASQDVKVEAIWITHGHIDHAGGASELRDELGVDVIGPHKDDAFLLDNLVTTGLKYGLTEGVRNITPDRWLEEGNKVTVAGHEFDVLHCPGHAPGHVVFYNAEAHFAIVGDVLFNGSIGRTDLPGGDHAALIRSIKEKLLPLGDDIGFLCGHGPGGRFGEERRNNPFLNDIGYA